MLPQNYSTYTAVTIIIKLHYIGLWEKIYIVAVALFVYVPKAFNFLNHDILLRMHKLYYYFDVHGDVSNWLKNYLTLLYRNSVINNNCSLCSLMESGIPQGSILGPLLYIIYMNDIFNVEPNVKCILYADDTVLILHDKDINNLFKRCLQILTQYSV